jgi:hypothetical protein
MKDKNQLQNDNIKKELEKQYAECFLEEIPTKIKEEFIVVRVGITEGCLK